MIKQFSQGAVPFIIALLPLLSLWNISTVIILSAITFLFFVLNYDAEVKLGKVDYWFMAILALPLLTVIMVMLITNTWEWSYVDLYLRHLLGGLSFFFILKSRESPINLSWLKLGFYAAALLGFACALYQKVVLGVGLASAGVFPISFGEIMTAVAVISLLSLEQNRINAPIWRLLAFVLASFASIIAGTKGAWVAYPFLLWLVFDFYFGRNLRKQLVISLGTLLLMGAVMWTIPFSRNRIKSAVSDVTGYYTKDTFTPTSQGLRLLMWNNSLAIYTEYPVFGVGPSQVNEEIIQACYNSPKSSVSSQVDSFKQSITHAHSDWIQSLVGQGIFGISTFALFVFFPLVYSFKQRRNTCAKARAMAYFNLLVQVGFSIFCLTQCLHAAPRELWITLCVLSFALLRKTQITY